MRLSGRGRVAGVMGWPVGHSRSPRLHGYWLETYGIDGAYVPLAVAPARLAEAIRALPALGFRGCNVTVPHKEAALAVVDVVDDVAARVGAVNTIVVAEDGRLEGRNTDGFGFLANVKVKAPGWRASSGPAVVIGAGGAARAVVVALLDDGAPEVVVINRTRERAEKLVADIGGAARVGDWVSRETFSPDTALIVNTTTLGMVGQPPLDLDLAGAPDGAVVNDIVYTPLKTPLLRAAAARGLVTVNGIGMLLHQARPGFAAWFGVEPEVDAALERLVLEG